MVQIGQHPILWHIMKFYASYGFEEFVVALGYKAEVVKNFFLQFADMASDLTIDLRTGPVDRRGKHYETWKVELIDTGLTTMTGGRLRRLASIVGYETFMLTYGDGVSDVPLHRLLAYHRSQRKLVTVAAVPAPARFGGIAFDGNKITGSAEKHAGGDGWINGGFMVMELKVFDYLRGDEDSLEISLLERLGRDDQLAAYKHPGFWQCMDTMREKQALEQLWGSEAPPWKRW
jgi:glucose-1-phosphate cytidylyltransferase